MLQVSGAKTHSSSA